MKNLTLSIKPNWDAVKESPIYPVGSDFAANQNYTLGGGKITPATKDALGGIIVGNNLVVTEDGTLSAIGEGVAGVSSFNNRTKDVTLTGKDVTDALGFSPTPYKLNPATQKVLGGVKVGENLSVTEDGTISADQGVATFNSRKGEVKLEGKDVESALGFMPEKLAAASAKQLGGIKVGKNLSIEADGTLNAAGGGDVGVNSFNGRQGDVKLIEKDITDLVPKYDLPIASEKALGGIIVGDNLSIDAQGRLSATGGQAGGVESFNNRSGKVTLTAKDVTDVVEIPKPYDLPIASKTALGGFKVGKNLSISSDGTLDAQGGSAAGVSSFNERTGDVTLTKEDVVPLVPVLTNKAGEYGMVRIDSDNYGDIIVEDGYLYVNPRHIILPDTYKQSGLRIVPNGRDICMKPATKYGIGGVVVGNSLTVKNNKADNWDETNGTIDVNVDGKTIVINDDGTISAKTSEAGVASFNGRTGAVELTEEDVVKVAPVADNENDALGLVKVAPDAKSTVFVDPTGGHLRVNPAELVHPDYGIGYTHDENLQLGICVATPTQVGGLRLGKGLTGQFLEEGKVFGEDTDDWLVDVAIDGETIEYNEKGELTVKVGTAGAAYKIIGSCETIEELREQIPVGKEGWGVLVGDMQDLYSWLEPMPEFEIDKADWYQIGELRGEQGDRGADGAKGEKGDKGDTGAKGDSVVVPATKTTLGGVKVGSGLAVTADGTLSTVADPASADEYTYKIYDFGATPFKVTVDSKITASVTNINLKKSDTKSLFPSQQVVITVAKAMDSFYADKNVLIFQVNLGKRKLKSYYDSSDIDVGVDCIEYIRVYTNTGKINALRVDGDWIAFTIDATKIVADMSLVADGRSVFTVEPTKGAVDTGNTVTFTNHIEQEFGTDGTVWKKSNLIGCQTITVAKNQLFTYDYRLYKTYGNGQAVLNIDVPSNSFSGNYWSKTLAFRDIGIPTVQSDHTIVVNVLAQNKLVASPFSTGITGGAMAVKIPYTANGGDRIVKIECYDNMIMVSGDPQSRAVSVVAGAYSPPKIKFAKTQYNPLANVYLIFDGWIDAPSFSDITEWRVVGTNGSSIDRVIAAPEYVDTPNVPVKQLALLAASIDTEPAKTGSMSLCLITTDKNGNKRKSAVVSTTIAEQTPVTPIKLGAISLIPQDDKSYKANIQFDKPLQFSINGIAVRYSITKDGVTKNYCFKITDEKTMFTDGYFTMDKNSPNGLPSGDYKLFVNALSTVNYSPDSNVITFAVP